MSAGCVCSGTQGVGTLLAWLSDFPPHLHLRMSPLFFMPLVIMFIFNWLVIEMNQSCLRQLQMHLIGALEVWASLSSLGVLPVYDSWKAGTHLTSYLAPGTC